MISKKVKVKSLCLTNQALCQEGVWESGCIDPCFLELGTSWRWVVSFTPQPLYPRERATGTHWIGGWVGPRTGLDDMEKRKFLILLGLELWPLGRPACNQSLYQLLYSGSFKGINLNQLKLVDRSKMKWHFSRLHIMKSACTFLTQGNKRHMRWSCWVCVCTHFELSDNIWYDRYTSKSHTSLISFNFLQCMISCQCTLSNFEQFPCNL
jgi:hypothetical protein